MALEALSRALSQVSRDYAFQAIEARRYERAQADEQRRYERNRGAQLADVADNRDYAKELREEQRAFEKDLRAQIGDEKLELLEKEIKVRQAAEIAQLGALDQETLRQQALKFGVPTVGIDGKPRTRSLIETEIAEKSTDRAAEQTLRAATAQLQSRSQLAEQTNTVEQQEQKPQRDALLANYQDLIRQRDAATEQIVAVGGTPLIDQLHARLGTGAQRDATLRANRMTEADLANPAQLAILAAKLGVGGPGGTADLEAIRMQAAAKVADTRLREIEQSLSQLRGQATQLGVALPATPVRTGAQNPPPPSGTGEKKQLGGYFDPQTPKTPNAVASPTGSGPSPVSLPGFWSNRDKIATGLTEFAAVPGRAIDTAGRYATAGLGGFFTGDYSVPKKGLIERAGEAIGGAIAPAITAAPEKAADLRNWMRGSPLSRPPR